MSRAPVRPPRLARWLLRRALDGAARSAIVGDLDEEFTRFIAPRLGARRARAWYWRQALTSIAACLRGPAARDHRLHEPTSVRSALMQDRQGWATDARAAGRFTVRRPLLSIVVIVTLAVGIAANTAVFSVLNATFLKPLPIAHAARLVTIEAKQGGSFSYPEYLASRDAPGLAAVFAGGRLSTTLGDEGTREQVVVDVVTGNFFDAIGVRDRVRGRLFHEDDDRPGGVPVAVLSDRLWRERFNADPAAIGQTIRLHQAFYTVIGVAPAGFSGIQMGYGPELWVPLSQGPSIDGNPGMLAGGQSWLGLAGILQQPDAFETARASLSARWQSAGRLDEAVLTSIPRGRAVWREDPQARLRVLGLFVILIFVIGCLNVSTLLGANVHARQKELAIRATLGAGRLRLLRQLLLEHLLLAGSGGALGGVLGVWLACGLALRMESRFTPGDLDVSLDARVLLFTVTVSLLAGIAVGFLPAARWSRVHSLAALQGGAGGMTRLLRTPGLWWLIPWQVALGTVLLASTGLLLETVHQLRRGIESTSPDRVWFADLGLDDLDPRAFSAAAFGDFQARLRTHVSALPGTEAVGISTLRPLASLRRGPLFVQGMTTTPKSKRMAWGPPPPPPPPGQRMAKPPWVVSNHYVTPGFFPALGMPVIRGRDFTDADAAGAPGVAIVNETLAARAFGTGDPIGRRVSFAAPDRFDIEIVGVVRDLRYEHLRESAPDGIFFPLAQTPAAEMVTPAAARLQVPSRLTLVMRARDGVTLTRDAVRAQALGFDPRLFVNRIWTFDEEAARALSEERLLGWLGSVLGLIALVLLVVGLYGAMAAAVIRGRRELGIRLALGASPRSLRALILGRSVSVVTVGLMLGLPLAYAATKYFAHLLYGVQPIAPRVGVTIVAVVLGTAAVSAYLPARRAGRVDPVVALRAE